MEKIKLLYEGKAKKVYTTEDSKEYIVHFKNDATAGNGLKKGSIKEKGRINNSISSILFEVLESKGVSTHYIKKLNDVEMLVKALEIIPLEVLVRNVTAGSLSKRMGLKEGIVLDKTIVEFCYKKDELGDPMINEDHIDMLKLATPGEVKIIKDLSLKINRILQDIFKELDIQLVDFKLEFGRVDNGILLADEISPDTCRLWDMNTAEKLDKDRFRRDLGSVEEAYLEVLNRLGGK